MKVPQPNVGVVVVTYRSHGVLPQLLSSLARNEPAAHVVIVDNASPTGPPASPSDEVLLSDENRGYGWACNAGAARLLQTGVTHLAFLNPDVDLQGPSLTQLALHTQALPRAGIVTGPLLDAGGDRIPSAWGPTSAARALWFATGLQTPRARRALARLLRRGIATSDASTRVERMQVDGHVLGGAMVVRADCFQELGGFDESFFMYWEDADLCHRARAAGWEVWLLPCTPMVHRAGTSSVGVTSEQRWLWYLEGAERFAQRHLDPAARRRLLAALQLGRRLRHRR